MECHGYSDCRSGVAKTVAQSSAASASPASGTELGGGATVAVVVCTPCLTQDIQRKVHVGSCRGT
eukprot:5993215-Amphidinium_carterae.1